MKRLLYTLFLFFLNFALINAQDSTNVIKVKKSNKEQEKECAFRASVNYGLSYIPGKIPDDSPPWIIPYLNKLRMGNCISADLNFYTYKTSGFTIKSSMMKTENQMDGVKITNQNGQLETGIMRDNISVFFIGGGMFGRGNVGNSKSCFIDAQLALGYLSFTNNAVMVQPLNIGGHGFAGYCSFGFDYLFSKNFAVGFDIGSPICTLREIGLSGAVNKIMKLDLEHSVQISRLNFSIGIKAYAFE